MTFELVQFSMTHQVFWQGLIYQDLSNGLEAKIPKVSALLYSLEKPRWIVLKMRISDSIGRNGHEYSLSVKNVEMNIRMDKVYWEEYTVHANTWKRDTRIIENISLRLLPYNPMPHSLKIHFHSTSQYALVLQNKWTIKENNWPRFFSALLVNEEIKICFLS